MEIKTEFSIGEAVYVADTDKVEKKLIDKIKIVDEKGNYRYGFKDRTDYFYFSFYRERDQYSWEKPSVVFNNKRAATAHMRNLKTIEEEKERRKEILKAQIEALDEE